MKILITGGSGFIGSHIVDNLVQTGHQVFVYDLPVVGNRFSDPNVAFIPGSILDMETLRQAMIGTDAVYHLAAIADVIREQATGAIVPRSVAAFAVVLSAL